MLALYMKMTRSKDAVRSHLGYRHLQEQTPNLNHRLNSVPHTVEKNLLESQRKTEIETSVAHCIS
jgi:hypothetical protein